MIKYSRNFIEFPILIFLLALSVILCLFKNFSTAVLEGISLWFASVLPSLFPYFFITSILSSLGVAKKLSKKLTPITSRLFNVGGNSGYALLLSVISGYPVGAKMVSDLKERGAIGNAESVRAACICSTSSPMFLISCIGGITFNSTLFGALLLFSHLLGCFSVGIIFSFYKRKEKPSFLNVENMEKVDNILYQTAYSAVISSLVVGALITIFYLLTEILLYFNILSPLTNLFNLVLSDQNASNGLVLGLFECTRGLKSLSIGGITALSLPIASFVCGFGGLSVIAQSLAYLKKAKIKTAPFLFAKFTHAVLSSVYSVILSFLFLL